MLFRSLDLAMFDPSKAGADYSKLTMSELMQRRAKIMEALEAAEAQWMQASEAVEGEG